MNASSQEKRAKPGGSAAADAWRTLAQRFQQLLEKERTRLAQELHDNLTQKLTVVSLELSLLESGLDSEQELSPVKLREKLQEIGGITNDMIQSLRRIKSELRPKVLDEFGLVAAIEWESNAFAKKAGIECRFRAEPGELAVPAEVATELFRIFQQILANILAHSKARRVRVELKQEKSWTTLQVKDDGIGITAEQVASSKSVGLLELRQRAKVLRGDVRISGSTTAGTTVLVRIPRPPALRSGASS